MHVLGEGYCVCICCAGEKAGTQTAKTIASNFLLWWKLFSKKLSKGFSIFVALGSSCTLATTFLILKKYKAVGMYFYRATELDALWLLVHRTGSCLCSGRTWILHSQRSNMSLLLQASDWRPGLGVYGSGALWMSSQLFFSFLLGAYGVSEHTYTSLLPAHPVSLAAVAV